MRKRRKIVKGVGYYHVISRISGRRFLINEEEKARFKEIMYRVAEFSGVDVLTFAFMDNHFHLLIRIPVRQPVDDEELLRRMCYLYPFTMEKVMLKWEIWKKNGNSNLVEDEKKRLRARMYNLSEFCKSLKQIYSVDYNRRNQHIGTMWCERFKSIIISPDYETLMSVAAYIDLNPVRAGIVDEPGKYTSSAWGEASQGDIRSQRCIRKLVAAAYARENVSWEQAARVYQAALQGVIGSSIEVVMPKVMEEHFDAIAVQTKLALGQPLTLFELLRCKVRHFSAGIAIGIAEFVTSFLEEYLPDIKKKQRPCNYCSELHLYTASGLRGEGKVKISNSAPPSVTTLS